MKWYSLILSLMKSQRSYLVKKKMLVKKFMRELFLRAFLIFQFFTDKIVKESNIDLPKDVINKFKRIRMSYYKDKWFNSNF